MVIFALPQYPTSLRELIPAHTSNQTSDDSEVLRDTQMSTPSQREEEDER
jgi:hypothetical protein